MMQYKHNRIKVSAERLIRNIVTQPLPAQCIILFGSVATGRFNEFSDIDLCIVYAQDGMQYDIDKNFDNRCTVENYIKTEVEADVDVDFVHCTPQKLLEGDGVFANIRKEGVVIYGEL